MKKNFYIVFGVLLIADTTFHIINTLYFRSSKSLINGTTIIKSSMNSYFSLKNIAFKEDNGTRVYIEPAAKTDKNSSTINESGNIVSGVGGVLKILEMPILKELIIEILESIFTRIKKVILDLTKQGIFL